MKIISLIHSHVNFQNWLLDRFFLKINLFKTTMDVPANNCGLQILVQMVKYTS